MPFGPALFRLLPPRGVAAPPLPAGAAEAAGQLAAGGQTQTLLRMAHVAASAEPDRRGGDGRDDAARSLHAALCAGHRAQSRSGPRHAARILSGARRRHAHAGALGDAARAPSVSSRSCCRSRCTPEPSWQGRSASTSWRIRRERGRHAAALSRGGGGGADSDAPLRAGRVAGAAHRLQLQLLHRLAAGSGRKRRARAGPARTSHRLRPSARRLHVQDRRAAVVDRGRALRRVVLRHSVARHTDSP